MGRRSSILGTVMREMAKSANRAAAESRRRARRADAMQSRAIERQMVRFEREQERARARAEREHERRRIAEERERAAQRKQEAKEAQLRAWKLECEEHQEREEEIERIANDAPEVEDRDRLYAELSERRVFEPRPFVAPAPPDSQARAWHLRAGARHEVEAAMASFRPDTRGLRKGQMVAGGAVIGGFGLLFSGAVASSSVPLLVVLVGLVGVAVTQLLVGNQANGQRAAFRRKVEQQSEGRLHEALGALAREDAARAQAMLEEARAAYEAETAAARAQHEREEDARLQALRELGEGRTSRMREALEGVLPLDLPVPCDVAFDVVSSSVVSLDIDLPEPSVLPATEAKLLASGKVSYKEKNERRLREQYLRLAAGLVLRHASEVMLNLPTCQRVNVRAFRTGMDPAVGRQARRVVAEVEIDHAKLAPITMEGIDPLMALENFEYRIHIDRNRELQALRLRG